MREYNAWGLFSLVPVPGGFATLVHNVPIVGPVSYEAAHELFIALIAKTTALDGNYRALACAWAQAAHESENARHVQERCTTLINETRDHKAKLKAAHALLSRVRGVLPADATELLAEIASAIG